MLSLSRLSEARPIRVLIDRSWDSGPSDALLGLEPDTAYMTTDNRAPLGRDVLRKYHVLTICGYSPVHRSEDELKAIKDFVEQGGALLLCSHAGLYERDTGLEAPQMPANGIAEVFGFRFLAPQQCAGETEPDRHLTRGYRKDCLEVIAGNLPSGMWPEELTLGHCCAISVPEGSPVLVRHKTTGEPIAAMAPFGRGKVLVVGDITLSSRRREACRSLLLELASDAPCVSEEPVPDEIGPPMKLKKHGELRVEYDLAVEDRVNGALKLWDRVAAAAGEVLGQELKRTGSLSFTNSCFAREHRWDRGRTIGLLYSEARLCLMMARAALWQCPRWRTAYEFLEALVNRENAANFASLQILRRCGYDEAADSYASAWLNMYDEACDEDSCFDLARLYYATEEWHAKGFWALHKLAEKHGADLMRKLLAIVPEKQQWKNIPVPYAWKSDVAIYYLSRAVGEDLFPWFREIGTTVHPLPILDEDSEEFRAKSREMMAEAARTATASERDEAILTLAAPRSKHDEKEEEKLPEDAPIEGPVGNLVAAVRLADGCDEGAAKALRSVMNEAGDEALQAIAALHLLQVGDTSCASQLVELARKQDCRFRLEAGYVLQKAGCDVPKDLTLTGLKDEKGNPAGEMEIIYDGDCLSVHPKVEGRKVANIISSRHISHLAHNAHASLFYVYWVHTSPQWRRKGLSRQAMDASFSHALARTCSCMGLGTGTRNVAHALYRGYRFVDSNVGQRARLDLTKAAEALPVLGVAFRDRKEGDAAIIAELSRELRGGDFEFARPRICEPGPNSLLRIAERGGSPIGFVSASVSGEEAHLSQLCVKKDEARDAVADGLLALIHRALHDEGAKTITCWHVPDDFVRKALVRSGYSYEPSGGVSMFGVRDLRMLLEECRHAFEKRLADSDSKDWCGTVDLCGQRLTGRLVIKRSEVRTTPVEQSPASVVIRCSDDEISRFLCGNKTPFEAYLQLDATIEPRVNHRIAALLETLFPRLRPTG